MKKYDIAWDVRMARHTGIGTYIRGILPHLLNKAGAEKRLAFFGPGNAEMLGIPGVEKVADWVPFDSPIYSLQEQWKYRRKVGQCRLWHSPHYNVPVTKPRGTALVTTVHDLIHWIFRKDYLTALQSAYASYMFRQAVRVSDHLITVSEHTKQDLIREFGADPARVSVIYEGFEPRFRKVTADAGIFKKYGISHSFFLYVGLIKPHKNVDLLVRAFHEARKAGKLSSDLVIIGKKNDTYPKRYEGLKDLKSGEGVHYFSSVEEKELIAFYSYALALAHPSRYEGFGLTLLEAMACETPVLACRAASIPEVAGDAALLVPPDDYEAFKHGMIRMEQEPHLRDDLIRRGRERIKAFQWQKAADQTWAIYEKVLEAK